MKYYLSVVLLLFCSVAVAQSGYDNYMRTVRENSPAVQALTKRLGADKVGNRTGIAPDDPEAEIVYFPKRGETNFELNITQSIDFPTVYTNRSKIAKLNNERSEMSFLSDVKSVMQRARELYMDAVYYNRKIALAERNRNNAMELQQIYNKRVLSGDATRLEKNKIDALLLEMSTVYRIAVTGRDNTLHEINTLSGGLVSQVTDTIYPLFVFGSKNEYTSHALEADFSLKASSIDTLIAKRGVKLSRAEWIPGIRAGYRLNMDASSPSSGVIAGISIPLWKNSHKLKYAKMSVTASQAENYNLHKEVASMVSSQYNTYQTLVNSIEEYNTFLSSTNTLDIINKALKLGEISMLEYFVELNIWYDVVDRIVELEHEAALASAAMRSYYE